MLPSCTIHFGPLNRPAWKQKEPVPPCGSPAPLFARFHRERIPTGPVLHSSLHREGPEENPLPGKGVFRSSMPSAVFRFRPPYREIPGSDSCHLPDSVVLPLQKKPLELTSGSKMTCPKRVAQSSISTNFCRARMPTYSQPCTPAVTTSVFPGAPVQQPCFQRCTAGNRQFHLSFFTVGDLKAAQCHADSSVSKTTIDSSSLRAYSSFVSLMRSTGRFSVTRP